MAIATTTIAIIGAVAAVASVGYGVYAGERASSTSARQYRQARADAQTQQQAQERNLAAYESEQKALYDKQVADQKATEDRLRSEQAASLEKVKAEVPGMQAQLGSDLLGQQEKAYAKMDPQIEARLNALGLLNSGALVEAKAKAQGDLESQRQAALADFGTNASQRLNIDQPLANSSADVNRQYEGLQRNLDLDRTNLSQTFANRNAAYHDDVARQQYLAGLSQANIAARQQAASSYVNAGAQVGSGLMGYAASRNTPSNTSRNTSLDALYSSRNAYSPTYYTRGRQAPR